MSERFIHRQSVHLPSMLIRAGLDGCFQVMPGCLDRQRVGYHPAGAPVVLHPCWMRQSNPYWPPARKKLHVDRIGVPGGDGNNQCLVNTMQLLSGPAVGGVKIIVHASKNISEQHQSGNNKPDALKCM